MKEMTEIQAAVLNQLGTGKEKAVPGKILAQRLNMRDSRRIRMTIIDLISERGIVIIGDAKHGYYIADNMDDAAAACDRMMSYLKSAGYHYKVLRKAAHNKLSGQLTLVR